MKIGVMIGADNPESGLNDVIDLAKKAEELGLDSVWLANIFFSFPYVFALKRSCCGGKKQNTNILAIHICLQLFERKREMASI